MDLRTSAVVVSALLSVLALGPGCSEKDAPKKDVVPDSNFGTDSLDSLSPGGAAPAPEPEPEEPVVIDQSGPGDEEPTDEEREWTEERRSQSTFGRSRDKARELKNDLQGGTDAENGLADTAPEDEWVGTSGAVWEMPEGWRMAIPGEGRIGEMFVPNDLGAASVAFTKESVSVEELRRQVAAMLVTPAGGRVTPRSESIEVLGKPVLLLSLEGTYIDASSKGSGNEKPFYAVRAAVVDLETTRVLIVMWGPEDTVTQNEGKFTAMIKDMKDE
jgi:hypothetical protein